MKSTYNDLFISEEKAASIAKDIYGITGKAKALPGELDFNFKISSSLENYILKVCRPDEDVSYIEFQQEILEWIHEKDSKIRAPKALKDSKGSIFTRNC